MLIAGVAVEGDGAASAIVSGLAAAGASGADVVILARGGGSYEDLMPFNDEAVARAIAACPVPVVTGIGHEPDTTIADMVADLRASTPTAAAEAVAPSCDEVSDRLGALRRLLGRGLLHAARDAERRVAVVRSHAIFRDPRGLLATSAQRLDLAAAALPRAVPQRLLRERERLEAGGAGLARSATLTLERSRELLGRGAARLHDLSPLGILGRGYAVCYAEDRRTIVRSVSALSSGDTVHVRLHDGDAGCVVESVEREGD